MIFADLSDTAALRDAAHDVDAVIHCAASDNPSFWPISQAAAGALIAGLQAGGAFASHSGTIVFGDTGSNPSDPDRFAPPPPLAGRATLDEAILEHEGNGITIHIGYGAFVYGRGRGAALPTLLIGAAKSAGAALYVGNGDQIWSTVNIDDFGALLVDAIESKSTIGGKWFAAETAITMKGIAERIGQALGLPARPATTEEAQGLFGPFAGALAINQNFSAARTREGVGWAPQASSLYALDQAINDLILMNI